MSKQPKWRIPKTTAIHLLLLVTSVVFIACVPEPTYHSDLKLTPQAATEIVKKIEGLQLRSGFPAEKDLAILIPLDTDYPIAANISNGRGDGLLPRTWLRQVSQAYRNTDVGEALDSENSYDDWRLVSVRVSPCMPLGLSFAQQPDDFCWPAVRLVWQPVLEDTFISGVRWGEYADDRAIHASYHVRPNGAEGDVLKRVRQHLARGGAVTSLSNSDIRQFEAARDAYTQQLLDALYRIRLFPSENELYRGIETRPAYNTGRNGDREFRSRLVSFLNRFAEPNALVELTSFSLPEGRIPSLVDIWVFIAFDAFDGNLSQKDLQIFDARSGRELVNMGPVQTVTQTEEDPVVIDALTRSPSLRESVIFNPSDLSRLSSKLADPDQLLVPNTSCASCHRLNDLRFNLHNLSHLEDRPATVSSRVVQDVAKDIRWIRSFRSPITPEPAPSPVATSPRQPTPTNSNISDRFEPNNDFSQATAINPPIRGVEALGITKNDRDYFIVQHRGGTLDVKIEFSHAKGDLDLVLYDGQRRNLAKSDSSSNNEQLTKILAEGRYYVEVYGYSDAQANYSLSITSSGPSTNAPASTSPPTSSNRFEPNNSIAQATQIQLPFDNSSQSITRNDNDYFVFETRRSDVTILADIERGAGDLDIELYTANGTKLEQSNSTSSQESITQSLEAGRYVVRVFGYSNATGNYRLRIQSNSSNPSANRPTTPETSTSMTYEPNDTSRTATQVSLPFTAENLAIGSSDQDFYRFTTERGFRTISIDFSHNEGDLDLYLYDSNGNQVQRSASSNDNESIAQNLAAGSYWVRILGYRNATASYSLSIR